MPQEGHLSHSLSLSLSVGVGELHAMELDRENRRLEMGPKWGTRLAERMVLTESKPPRLRETDKVRYDLICSSKQYDSLVTRKEFLGLPFRSTWLI